jgi:hypothetical protein
LSICFETWPAKSRIVSSEASLLSARSVMNVWRLSCQRPVTPASGVGAEVIMSIAGHVSRAMLSRYSHVRMESGAPSTRSPRASVRLIRSGRTTLKGGSRLRWSLNQRWWSSSRPVADLRAARCRRDGEQPATSIRVVWRPLVRGMAFQSTSLSSWSASESLLEDRGCQQLGRTAGSHRALYRRLASIIKNRDIQNSNARSPLGPGRFQSPQGPISFELRCIAFASPVSPQV